MRNKMKFIVISFMLIFSCLNIVMGQKLPAYVILGKVQDNDSSASPLPGALVIVIDRNTNTQISGASTDIEGKFILNNVPDKPVKVRFSLLGYEVQEHNADFSSDDSLDFGIIKLKQSFVTKKEIVIKGERKMIEYYLNKQVVNIDKLPYTGNTVAEALSSIGAVEVEPVSGSISLRGKKGIKVLVDGKPVQTGSTYLSHTPAYMFEKIEVITAPSAKEDPEGDAGIINLIQKKSVFDSFSGNISGYQATDNRSSFSSALNYKNGNINVFSYLSFSLNRHDNPYTFYSFRPGNYSLSSISGGSSTSKSTPYNLKLGFDYDINKTNSFSLTGALNNNSYSGNDKSTGVSHQGWNNFVFLEESANSTKYEYINYNMSAYYRKKINRKGGHFTSDLYFADIENKVLSDISNIYGYEKKFPDLYRRNNYINQKTVIFKADYENPVSRGKNYEAGYSFTFRDRSNDYINLNYNYTYNDWLDSLGYSNFFHYKERIHAAYFMYTDKIAGIEYRLGIRTEKALNDGLLENSAEIFRHNYWSYYPSVNLAYNLEEFQLYFNFSRRVTRPDMESLNPFVKSSRYGTSKGNFSIEPAYENKIEAGFSPYLNLYYNNTQGGITNISTVVRDTLYYSTYVNGLKTYDYGTDVVLYLSNSASSLVKLPAWFQSFNLLFNYTRFVQKGLYPGIDLNDKYSKARVSASSSFNIFYDLITTLRINYRSGQEGRLTARNSYVFYSIAVSKSYLDKKLRLSITFMDALHGMESERFDTFQYSKMSFSKSGYPSMQFSVNYSFNSFREKAERSIDDGRDAARSVE